METCEEKQGLVFYTDGGCGPTNPGFIGFGIHGYMYTFAKPKKGAGLDTHILTNNGYVSKFNATKKEVEQVTPIHYFDIVGGRLEYGTNNVAELMAMSMAFQKALEYNICRATFITDSEYVLKGITEWSKSWIKNNWVRQQDGNPVPNADIWKPLLNNFNILKDRGVEVHFTWVRGHGDGTDNSFGNLLSDRYATVGKALSTSGKSKNIVTVKVADGYWKSEVEKNPLLCHRSMYFSTDANTQVPGEYYIGSQSKDDEFIGTRISDGAYAVVQLEEADTLLEFVRTHQNSISGEYEKLVKISLDSLYNPQNYSDITEFGEYALTTGVKQRITNLYTLNGDAPITTVLDPQRLASRAFDCIAGLKAILMAYRMDELKTTSITDITDVLYSKEVIQKKTKTEVKISFKPEYNVGFSALPVVINLNTDHGVVEQPVTLTLGIDLPDRNTLKRLEDESTKVVVLAWMDAPDVARYASVIVSKGDYSIWCGYYSNMIFLNDGLKSV